MSSVLGDFPNTRKAWEYARVIPTGFPSLDTALGIGGIPSGSIVELTGPISSGKSTLCLKFLAAAQKLGGWCAFIDADQAWEPGLARRCGVDLSRLLICNMLDLSSALAALSILTRSGALSLAVLDSINPFHPVSAHPNQAGQQAESLDKLVSRTLRQIAPAVAFFQTAVVITCLSFPPTHPIYHDLARQTSRLALKMHAAIRIRLSELREETNPVNAGRFKVTATIIKNSFHPCQQSVDLDIM